MNADEMLKTTTTTKMKQIMGDELSESNCSRLLENTVERRKLGLFKQHKSSPKSRTLPFYYHKHSDTDAPPSLEINRIHDHRTDLIRWHSQNGHPQQKQHHHHQQHQQPHHNHQLNSHGHTATSTQKYFSKKFSSTQHSNHLSRFYMIFIVILIYLLDKINCDQGECIMYILAIKKLNLCQEYLQLG